MPLMNSYVISLKGISPQDAISFQEIFRYEQPNKGARYTPFESFEDPYHEFPLTVLGELGSIFNTYGKHLRNNRDWSKDTADEIADTFIYLLIFAMTVALERNDTTVLEFVEQNWSKEYDKVSGYEELFSIYHKAVGDILSLQNKEACTSERFAEIFISIQRIASQLTNKTWQEIIDAFHVRALNWHLDVTNYTPDLWFLGNSYINHGMFVDWLKQRSAEGKIAIPSDRIVTFERFAKIRSKQENGTI